MKNTVIFDLDGTLLDTLDDLTGSANYALKEMGFPLRSRQEIRSFVGNGILVLIKKCLPPEADEETINKTLDLFTDHYGKHCNDLTRPYPGILQLIEALRKKGIKMGIVSNKADFAVKELARIYFKGAITVAIGEKEKEGVRKKPAPDTLFKAQDQLESRAEDSVYVGDSEVDIKTAENAGLDLVLCSWGFRDEDFLRAQGTEVIIHDPMELFDIMKLQ